MRLSELLLRFSGVLLLLVGYLLRWITVAFGGLFVAFVRITVAFVRIIVAFVWITVAFGGLLLQAERRRLPVGHRAARRHRKQALPRPVRVHQCLSESPAGLNRLSVRRRCRSLRVGSSCGAPLLRRRVPHPFACLFVCLFVCMFACLLAAQHRVGA